MPFRYKKRPCPSSPFQKAPVLRWLCLFVAAIVAAWCGRDVLGKAFWSMVWLPSLAALVVLLVYSYVKKRDAVASLWILPLAALGLFGLAGFDTAYRIEQIRVDWPQEKVEQAENYSQTEARPLWFGVVERYRKEDDKYIRAEIRLENARKEYNGKILHLTLQKPSEAKNAANFAPQAQSSDSSAYKLFTPGNLIAFRAQVDADYEGGNPSDFDYSTYLLQQGISGTAFVPHGQWRIHELPDAQVCLSHRFLRLRSELVEKYAGYFNAEQTAILAALTLGDKTRLQPEIRSLFAETGTSHVLALSGLHLSILFSLLQFLFLSRLRRFSHRIACQTLLVLSLWLFVYLAGAPISLQRAAWMLTFMQFSQLLSRHNVQTYSSLSVSALLLLLYNPLILFDISFQLSFTAVFSIVTFNQYLWRRFPLPKYKPYPHLLKKDKAAHTVFSAQRLRNALNTYLYRPFTYYIYPFLTVSLSAQIGTAPLIAHYFHLLSPLGIVANFLVVPAAYILLSGALLFFLVPIALVRVLLSALMQQVMEIMTAGLGTLSALPFATFPVYLGWPVWMLLILLPILLYALFETRKTHLRRLLFIFLPVLVLLGTGGEKLWRRHIALPPQIALYKTPHSALLHLVAPAGTSYLLSPQPLHSVRPYIALLEKNYFLPHHLPTPQWVGQHSVQTAQFERRGPCILFQGQQILYLSAPLQIQPGADPLPIDLLILARGCTTPPEVILAQVRPRQIVLDPGLPVYRRRQWQDTGREFQIPCHSLTEQGYYRQLLAP